MKNCPLLNEFNLTKCVIYISTCVQCRGYYDDDDDYNDEVTK